MQYKEVFYPESRFGGFSDIDGTIAFFNRVNSLLEPSFTVLDFGCGRGAYNNDTIDLRKRLRILKGKVAKVIGIDVDKSAEENPFLDEFYLIDGNEWPVKSNAIDLVLCDNVLEHLYDPGSFFSEARRVLKNNGCLCIRTPNSWSYIALFSKIIPNKYHSKVTKIVQNGRKCEDVFPTVYKCNSLRRIRAMMKKYKFESVVYGFEAEPSYLSFMKIAYWFGVLHQKYAPSFIKPGIFAFGKINKENE